MTREQENTVAGEMIARYREVRAKHGLLAFKAQGWGRLLIILGKTLTTCGDTLPNLDLSRFPEKAEVLNTQEELASLNAEITQLRKHVGSLGIEVTSRLDFHE